MRPAGISDQRLKEITPGKKPQLILGPAGFSLVVGATVGAAGAMSSDEEITTPCGIQNFNFLHSLNGKQGCDYFFSLYVFQFSGGYSDSLVGNLQRSNLLFEILFGGPQRHSRE